MLVTRNNKAWRSGMTTLHELSRKLQAEHGQLGNWRAVGSKYGITEALAFRIAKEQYDPKGAALRTKLGLPALTLAPVCTNCGVVHTLGDICPQVTPVRITAYQVTPEELANIPQPVVVVRRRRTIAKPRRRARVELPADITPEQRTAINRLSPSERLNALIEASKRK